MDMSAQEFAQGRDRKVFSIGLSGNLDVLRDFPMAIACLDEEQNFIEASDVWSEFLGIQREDLVGSDLSRWMGAVSDIDNAEKQAKNPPLFKKLFDKNSIEQVAIQAYSAKKKLEEQRYELKVFLNMTYGVNAYSDLLAMEGQIRKQRQEMVYKQQKMRQQMFEVIGWIFLGCLVLGFIGIIAMIWSDRARAIEPFNTQNSFIIREYNERLYVTQ